MHRGGNMGDAEVTSSSSISAKKPKNDSGGDDDTENSTKLVEKNSDKEDEDTTLASTVEKRTDSIKTTGNNVVSSSIENNGNDSSESQKKIVGEQAIAQSEIAQANVETEEEIDLKISFNKTTFPVTIGVSKTIGDLKKIIESHTKVSPALQKVVIKGMPSDDTVISSLGLNKGAKVLVIGTKLDDVLKVTKPVIADSQEKEEAAHKSDQSNWSSLTQHRKIIDKGVPDDAMAGILNENEPLPSFPLHGMLSSKGAKVRLTFKLANDEIWIGTKERTDKVPIASIRSIVSQPIMGFEHYHILAIQLGPTEASRLYIYWVPAQYVNAIKSTLSG